MTIEIICTLIATIAVVLGGVWFIITRAFNKGVDKNKFDTLDKKVSDLPCEKRKDEITETSVSIKLMLKELQEMRTLSDKLPCEDHKESIKDTKKRNNDISTILSSNNEILVEISKWVMKIDPNMIEQLTRKCSPYKMTSIGEIVFEISGAKNAMVKHSDFLLTALEKINPQTAYDVEDSALTVLIQNLGHELFIDVKSYLYNAPEVIDITDPLSNEVIKVRLSMQGIIKLMSLQLRDEYLSKHPDIK